MKFKTQAEVDAFEEASIDARIAEAAAPKSYKPEVIADSSGKWCGNSLRFRTREEAEKNVENLQARWLLVTDTRVSESEDEPTHAWTEVGLVRLDEAE